MRKATISFVMSVCLSAWNNMAPTGRIFMKFDIGAFSENLSTVLKFHYNRLRITGTLHNDKYTFLSYLAQFFIEWEIFQTKFLHKNRNTHLIFKNLFFFFFRKSCGLWDIAENYSRAGQATDDNTVHAHCMLDTWGYKDTLRICNTYCFSTATMVGRWHVSVTLYVLYIACLAILCVYYCLLDLCRVGW